MWYKHVREKFAAMTGVSTGISNVYLLIYLLPMYFLIAFVLFIYSYFHWQY